MIRPFKERWINRKELVNEAFILTLTTILVLFSDLVLDEDFKYDKGGWSFVLILCCCIVFNFYFVLKGVYIVLRPRVKKAYRITKNKVEPYWIMFVDCLNYPFQIVTEIDAIPEDIEQGTNE